MDDLRKCVDCGEGPDDALPGDEGFDLEEFEGRLLCEGCLGYRRYLRNYKVASKWLIRGR